MTLTILFRKMTILIFDMAVKDISPILAGLVFFYPEKGTLGKCKTNILSGWHWPGRGRTIDRREIWLIKKMTRR